MKFSIHIKLSFDEDTKEFIKSLFPDQKEIEDLTKGIKEKTEKLNQANLDNTPTT